MLFLLCPKERILADFEAHLLEFENASNRIIVYIRAEFGNPISQRLDLGEIKSLTSERFPNGNSSHKNTVRFCLFVFGVLVVCSSQAEDGRDAAAQHVVD